MKAHWVEDNTVWILAITNLWTKIQPVCWNAWSTWYDLSPCLGLVVMFPWIPLLCGLGWELVNEMNSHEILVFALNYPGLPRQMGCRDKGLLELKRGTSEQTRMVGHLRFGKWKWCQYHYSWKVTGVRAVKRCKGFQQAPDDLAPRLFWFQLVYATFDPAFCWSVRVVGAAPDAWLLRGRGPIGAALPQRQQLPQS